MTNVQLLDDVAKFNAAEEHTKIDDEVEDEDAPILGSFLEAPNQRVLPVHAQDEVFQETQYKGTDEESRQVQRFADDLHLNDEVDHRTQYYDANQPGYPNTLQPHDQNRGLGDGQHYYANQQGYSNAIQPTGYNRGVGDGHYMQISYRSYDQDITLKRLDLQNNQERTKAAKAELEVARYLRNDSKEKSGSKKRSDSKKRRDSKKGRTERSDSLGTKQRKSSKSSNRDRRKSMGDFEFTRRGKRNDD